PPHCEPTTTMLDIEVPRGRLEHGGDRQLARGAVAELDRAEMPGRDIGPAHHEDPTRPQRARVPDRLLEPAADDVAGDGGAEVTEPPREREGGRLLRGEVDDEELGSGERHRDALRLHREQRAPDVEREARGRALVAEPPEHLVVAPATR